MSAAKWRAFCLSLNVLVGSRTFVCLQNQAKDDTVYWYVDTRPQNHKSKAL